MTSRVTISTKTFSWEINTSVYNIIGKGAYGIVYKSSHKKYGEIAAKSIAGTTHKLLSQNVERLLDLNHENIVRIYDIHQTDEMLWMMMELCPKGDLNKFFNSVEVALFQKWTIMLQVTKGIEYLHCHYVIHRDIKPANILILDTPQLVAKLTDFDVTKILDPNIETSVMSSNVGTLAFKSPEFFRRSKQGSIKYHRSVDTYAAGLTFLAMLQYKKENRVLIPHIETPQEDSELFLPIGQLIAERIKYKVEELDVISLDGKCVPGDIEAGKSTADKEICKVKLLIGKMTNVKPEDRPTASEVLQEFENIIFMDIGRHTEASKNNFAQGTSGNNGADPK